jgi:hypothetical protein
MIVVAGSTALQYAGSSNPKISATEGTAMKHKKLKLPKILRGDGGRFDAPSYDSENQYAVIRSSICTGEKVAGFKDKRDGRFTEVMLIRSPDDIRDFKDRYNLDDVKVEY